jgi:thiol-disulfide isomerase/thioredoxin
VRYFIFLLAISVFVACSHKESRPTPGYYQLLFETENGVVPARLDITQNGVWSILNAEELIRLDSIRFTGDSFFVKLPLFDSSLRGTWRSDSLLGEWIDHSRKDYSVSFTGIMRHSASCDTPVLESNYEVVFSPDDSTEMNKGVAVLQRCGNVVTGTILTETGDYRYLQGEWNDNQLWLSAFDGTHLFYLSGEVLGDSITNGIFLSGKHWKESWVAVKSNTNTLRNPYSITTLQVNDNPTFTVLNCDESPVLFDSSTWKNNVSIIQIMGSWCPNCTDESRFMKELHASNAGLQIIPIAFERGDDVTVACRRVARQFNQLQLPYPFYYGGKASKEEAQKTLNFLTEVHSFPTTIFIDKKGVIRRVYTGYYGPGTHDEYEKHSAEIKTLVADLMNE